MIEKVKKDVEEIKVPDDLSDEEKWIVRIGGTDQGPFSSKQLYPRLLRGEIEPDTMVIDEQTFTRYRLKDIEDLKKYLHLHNTLNPILLEEQKIKEKEEFWKEKGRKIVIISILSVITLIFGGWAVWRVFIYKPQDIYLADGDFIFSAQPFQKQEQIKKKRKYWYWKRKVKRKSNNQKDSKDNSPKGTVVDFTGEGGVGIPKEKLKGYIRSKIATIFPCLKRQVERNSSFSGGEIQFTISGREGRVIDAKIEGENLRILNKCIKRKAKRWQFPTFPGNAVIYFPVYLKRR